MKTIQERIQDWIDTGRAEYGWRPYNGVWWESVIVREWWYILWYSEQNNMRWYSILLSLTDIFFWPSNYWEVMFPDSPKNTSHSNTEQEREIYRTDWQWKQIYCLGRMQMWWTIEDYLNDVLDDKK